MGSDNLKETAIDEVLRIVGLIETGVRNLSAHMEAVEVRLDKIESRLDAVESRFQELEKTVDDRLQQARPVWEAVLTRLGTMEERLNDIEYLIRGTNDNMLRSQARIIKVEDRLDKLEEKAS
jgi:chromosome segregation ATPase